MKNTCTIYLVRHGQSVANRDHIVSGHLDTELTDTGREQVLKTAQAIKNVNFDVAYSSDLKRAIETAEIILHKRMLSVEKLHDLRERNFGVLEGGPGEHLRKLQENHKSHYETLSTSEQWTYQYSPDLESNHMLSTRFLGAVEKIAQKNTGKTILIATHGGCIRTTLIKLGYLNEADLPSGSFANAGHVKLEYADGSFAVMEVNGLKRLTTVQ